MGFLISFVVPSIVRAQEKLKVIAATVKGIRAGVQSSPEEWSTKGEN